VSEVEADKALFAKAVKALGPYLGDLVVIGGWAHRLFGLHAMARAPGFQPLMTEDADIAAPLRMQKKGESIAALLKREGFAETFFGDETPPVSEYRIGDEDGGLYLEFLVPLIGSEHRRDGSRKATATVAGVSAQKLRYIDIAIAEPWTVRLSDQKGYPLGRAGLDVRIANAASYLAQKLLVFRERKPDKQAKDLLYIHDTLLIFSHSLDELGVLWKRIEPTLHPSTLRALARRRSEVLASVTDPARNAAVIAASTARADPPTAERLLATCRAGLARVFG
jgi:hypothetical protein